MSDDTTRFSSDTVPPSAQDGQTPMSDDVRERPNGVDGRFVPSAQVPLRLTDAQRRAVEMLLSGTPHAEIARACDVDVRTIYRWRHECEPFRTLLDRARRELWATAMYRMRAMLSTSLDVLTEELQNEDDSSRVRAASIVLAHSNVRKLMLDDIADRDG